MNIHFNFYLQCIKKILEVSCLDIGVTSFTINFHLVQLVLGQVSRKITETLRKLKKGEGENNFLPVFPTENVNFARRPMKTKNSNR